MRVPKTFMTSLYLLAFFLFASPVIAQQQTAPSPQEPPTTQQQDERPWLGVTIQEVNERIARQMGIRDIRGVLVSDVAEGSPAEDAGVNLGDVIVRLNGRDVKDASDFISRIQEAGVGSTVALEVNRGGATEEINVTLEPMPTGAMTGRYMPGQGMTGQGMGMMAMRGADQCPMGMQGMGSCPMVDACPGHGRMMGGMGMMGMGGQMMGRMDGRMAMPGGPMYGRIMMAIKGLNLTPEQKAKAEAIHSDYRKKQIRAKADAKVAHIELHELLAADPVNMEKVRAKVNELAQKRAEMMLTGIRSLEEFKKLLTPEQRKSFRDMLAFDSSAAEEMEEMEGGSSPGGAQ